MNNLTPITSKQNTQSAHVNNDRMRSSREIAISWTNNFEANTGGEKNYIKSGLTALDANLGGWLHQGHLILIAARPSMGKSALVQQIAENISVDSTTIFYTLEMQGEELAERSIARRTGISVKRLKLGEDFDDGEWSLIGKALGEFADLKLLIDDYPVYIDNIVSKSQKISEELSANGEKLGLIVVDYAQLVSTIKPAANKNLEVGAISRALKRLAMELSVPVVALAQLNREVEKRNDKRPVMTDLRDSGELEQDADTILFLYRDEVYDEHSNDKGIAEITASKNRHGELCTTKMAFVGHRMMFADLAHSTSGAEYVY